MLSEKEKAALWLLARLLGEGIAKFCVLLPSLRVSRQSERSLGLLVILCAAWCGLTVLLELGMERTRRLEGQGNGSGCAGWEGWRNGSGNVEGESRREVSGSVEEGWRNGSGSAGWEAGASENLRLVCHTAVFCLFTAQAAVFLYFWAAAGIGGSAEGLLLLPGLTAAVANSFLYRKIAFGRLRRAAKDWTEVLENRELLDSLSKKWQGRRLKKREWNWQKAGLRWEKEERRGERPGWRWLKGGRRREKPGWHWAEKILWWGTGLLIWAAAPGFADQTCAAGFYAAYCCQALPAFLLCCYLRGRAAAKISQKGIVDF